jgi:peptidoglycan/xylan/chitin deacetylase (PgdA/CDA1 family)
MHLRLEQLDDLLHATHGIGTVVSLAEIVRLHNAGRSTAGLIAFTADDAYASWLAAEPLLRRHGVPLTIFPVVDALASGSRFWWDRLFESVPRVQRERWQQFENECGLPQAYRLGPLQNEGMAHPLRQWILAEHAGRWPVSLEEPLRRLEAESGTSSPQRSMTRAELAGFVERTGAHVGCHTSSHAALPFLPDQELIAEVRQSLGTLRAWFPDALPYLAIPFGLFDARTLRLAAQAGVEVSLTLQSLPLYRPFGPDEGMPRFCVVREDTPWKVALKTSALSGLIRRVRGENPVPRYPVLPSPTT